MYINPTIRVHLTFAAAKDFVEKDEPLHWLEPEKAVSLSDVLEGTRNLIVGEPGVGKSLLLTKIQDELNRREITTALISLRDSDCVQQIDRRISSNAPPVQVLLLDALDEVRSVLFPDVLKKITEVSKTHPGLPIYLTARWVFVSRYPDAFPTYRFVTISPFTRSQVNEYLQGEGFAPPQIQKLIDTLSFRHGLLVIQIPRYLCYLVDYLKDFSKQHPLEDIEEISRNQLFEHFIGAKLLLEQKKLNAEQAAILARMLGKLALTMEIYQANSVSKDEVMTFFDELESDLKIAALSQPLNIFFENSLLKVSDDDVSRVAFDNAEFQEYLAAKEISRMADPGRAAFSCAADSVLNAIYPSWFNALTFLVDMQPRLLEQIAEFSGLGRPDEFRVLDEQFLQFIGKINVRDIPVSVRRKLFVDLIAYHCKWKQWVSYPVATALGYFYDSSLAQNLKSIVEQAEQESDASRYVPLVNVTAVIAELFKQHSNIDRDYWKTKLLTYVANKSENNVLKRHALSALEELNDPTVINSLPSDLLNSEDLVVRELLSLCATVGPDNPQSIVFFLEATKRGEIHAREGFVAFRNRESAKTLLETFANDTTFRSSFLDKSSIFGDRDMGIVNMIERVSDDELQESCWVAINACADLNSFHDAEHSAFVLGLARLLKKNDSAFFDRMASTIRNATGQPPGLLRFFFEDLLAGILERTDVVRFIDAMDKEGQAEAAFGVLARTRLSRNDYSQGVFEAGRDKLPDFYNQWDAARAQQKDSEDRKKDERILAEFKEYLAPEPDKYNPGVFEYYNRHADELKEAIGNPEKERLANLIREGSLKHNPISDVTITGQNGGQQITMKTFASTFGDALLAAGKLGIDVTPFRQNIINYIPLARGEELKAVFLSVKGMKPHEIAPVLAVYKTHHSDLWRYAPQSFVEAVEQYHLADAVPLLRELVKEASCDEYARVRALNASEALLPDSAFLTEVFDRYRPGSGVEARLAAEANGLLITRYGLQTAVDWRIKQVLDDATPFDRPTGGGVRSVGSLEEEMRGKRFAGPLLHLENTSYQETFLRLLDDAMNLWAKGREFEAYAQYIQEIVYGYFDNLKQHRSYEPLKRLEQRVAELQNRPGGNWLVYQLERLHRSYLSFVGKPASITEAVRKYNEARKLDNRKILNSTDLFRHLQDAIETDLRQWIEGEGAYDLIRTGIVLRPGRQQYEKLVQMTLKTQLQSMLVKRGFLLVNVYRESELLDGKKIDFLVQYGFSGPIGIEVKLTSNTDMKRTDLTRSESYKSMQRYMSGYNAPHGIFLVIDNDSSKGLGKIEAAFGKIQNVWVKVLSVPERNTASKSSRKKTRSASSSTTGRSAKKVAASKASSGKRASKSK